ncbi:hypothetical protein T09_11927 [Trichinella sp. T9]|nr:hypothetical protein T09_11927 [Trichinella sp. T9]
MFRELRGKLWSEIIARPAIGHLTRAHHCERGDIGRRALNLPVVVMFVDLVIESKFANGQCPASTSSAWHVGCLRQKQILIKADETPPLGKQAFWPLALSRASSHFATTTTTTIIIIIIAFAFLIAFAFPIAFAMLPGGVAASLSIYISIGKIDASQLSHGFVEKLTSVVPQPPHPLTNTALTGKPRFSLALQNSPYSHGEGWEKDYKGGCRWKVELDTCLSKAHLRQAVNSAEYKNDQFIVSVARVELFLNVKKNAAFEEGDSGKASRQLETDYQQLCNGKRALPVTFVQSEQFSLNFCSLMISKLAFDS